MKKVLYLILIFNFTSCSTDTSAIEDVLKKRWTALETKNIQLYADCISHEYPDREKLIKKLEENFSKIDSIQIQPQEPAIYINNDTATIYQEVRITLIIGGNRQQLETREKLVLKKTKRGWKITEGIIPKTSP